MLMRGFHDALLLWPTMVWPIAFSSFFYAYVRICQILRQRYAYSPVSGSGWAEMATKYVALPWALMVEIFVHGYMLYVVGYQYLVALIPIYVIGWVLLPSILEGFRPGLPILAIAHTTMVAAFAVLLGFMEVDPLRFLNQQIYSVLIGVPAMI